MNDTQLAQLKSLFDRAVELPSEERIAFIADSTSSDSFMQEELSSLLEAHDASDGYFENLAEEVIAPALAAMDLASQDEAVTDRKVAQYELLERIGAGGMGVVYKARDTRLGRIAALKFLPRHHASNPAARGRLLTEARAASRLDHPNIGIVYEIAETDDGRQFIAMAWYDGESLKERIRRTPVPVSEVVSIAAQLGSALSTAHAAGIIHRDVKPANVIVTRSGTVRLVDFGIAKLTSEDDSERLTAAGTVAYMSPEQTRQASLDVRTDLWSLGVLLYETLTGQRPFRGDADERVTSAIRNEEPIAIAALRPDVPPALALVVDRCLRKNPSERYQTAEEFCIALEHAGTAVTRVASTEDEAATPVIRARSITRQRAAVVIATLFVVASAAGLWKYSQRSLNVAEVGALSSLITVAVLPFTDADPTDSSRYLTEGLADDLRTELGRIASISVPSYLSSVPYSQTSFSIPRVAAEMAANFVVTGNVQRGPNGNRLTLRLVDGRTGKERLSRTYMADGNAGVDIVRAASSDLLSHLEVKLTKEDDAALRRDRTRNALAYDLYLRGRYAELSGVPRTMLGATPGENVRRAQAYYAQARDADPSFAPLRARLAMTHMWRASAFDSSRARLDQARLEAETALRLDPWLSDPYAALSAYWSREKNPEKAIEELEKGLRAVPNNVDLLLLLGQRYVDAGRWAEGLATYERAMRLDPRNPSAAWRVATTNGRLRRSAEALKAYSHLIELSPDDHVVKLIRGQAYLRWTGSPDTLLAVARDLPPDWDDGGMATFGRYTALRAARRYREGLWMLDAAKSELSRDGLVYHPKSLMRADFYYGLGDVRQARAQFEVARKTLADSSAAQPDDASIHAALGLAYAGLGQKREAIREAERAMDLVRVSGNSLTATAFMGLAVEVFARVGELDRAFEMIELLRTMPSGREITVPFLRVWPGFDPLRKDPRFDQLLQRTAVK